MLYINKKKSHGHLVIWTKDKFYSSFDPLIDMLGMDLDPTGCNLCVAVDLWLHSDDM